MLVTQPYKKDEAAHKPVTSFDNDSPDRILYHEMSKMFVDVLNILGGNRQANDVFVRPFNLKLTHIASRLPRHREIL